MLTVEASSLPIEVEEGSGAAHWSGGGGHQEPPLWHRGVATRDMRRPEGRPGEGENRTRVCDARCFVPCEHNLVR